MAELSEPSPLVVVFLRHSGCPFCREALADLSRHRDDLIQRGFQLVIVHQDTPDRGDKWIKSFGLDGAEQISDPKNELYQAFELGKASFWDLVGPHVWWSGFRASILKMHGVGKVVGDIKQLTGSFVVHHGKVVKAFRQKYSGDRTDYANLTCDIAPQ